MHYYSPFQLQQSLVDNFCSRIDYNEVITRRDLFKHLLFDDKYKIIYCFIPKTGCTKMKTLFLLLQGLYSLEQLFNKTVTHKNYLKKVKTLADLSVEERSVRLKSYYKFMIVRDPLERFVSGYRNKIGRSHAPKRFIKLQKDIMKDIHRYGFFFKRNPSFSEFVQYFLAHNEVFDDHFKPMVDICHPCYVKYHFYADFGMLDYDIDNFLRQMDIPIYFYFNGIRNVESLMPKDHYMTSYVPYYFNQLNDHLKKELMKNLIIDTQFYNNVSSS